MIGQHQNDHFDMVLQHMQKYYGAWFKKNFPQGSKVVIRLTWSKMTIAQIWLSFYFSFWFSLFSEWRDELGNVFKHSLPC